MKYDEIEPTPALARVVKVVWSLRGAAHAHENGLVAADRILPDGCPEIVVNRADRFRRILDDGSSHRQSEILLVGPLRRAIRIAPEGAVDLLGIRLRPGGLLALLGVPAHELVDVDMSLAEVAAPLVAELRAASARVTLAARVEGVERALLRQLEKRGRAARRGGLVGHAARLAAGGRSTVEQLSGALGVHRRVLERDFRVEVGLSPKVFLRIQRLQAVVGALEAGLPRGGWAQVALEHGYFDQPHLIRDFQLLAGVTPLRYLAERTDLAAAFELDSSRSSNP